MFLVLVILVLSFITLYYQTKSLNLEKDLQEQKQKYEILIKEPRVRNIIESGGWKIDNYQETLNKLKTHLLFKK